MTSAEAGGFSSDERVRYSRQIALAGWGIEAQEKLRRARIAVIGAGGLGSPALLYLAAAGVGTIGIVDDDEVALSNLHRQVIHDTAAIGLPKVDSAAHRLRALNPEIDVVVHRSRLTPETAVAIAEAYDIVLDGTDNFPTRYAMADACTATGTPLVWASVLGFDAQLSVFWPPHGPCLRCVFGEMPAPGDVPSCAEAGVIGVVPGLMGTAQAGEALKVATGVGDPLVGRLQILDALRGEWTTIPVRKDPACPACGDGSSADAQRMASVRDDPVGWLDQRELSAAEVAQWLKEREAGTRAFDLVDIREPWEWEINHIDGALDVPMGEVLAGALQGNGPYVLYCHVGVRSVRTLAALRAHGVDVFHLKGGIGAWIADIDPSQPTY